MSRMDQREIKILSDILALVLEEQSGQSETALEAIKSRARRDGITGGALKNLFQSLAPHVDAQNTPRTAADIAEIRTLENTVHTLRIQLHDRGEILNRMEHNLRIVRGNNENLKSQLHVAQTAYAEANHKLGMKMMDSSYPRLMIISVAVIAGLLAGIAGTQLFHLFYAAFHPVTDNARYLY
ncbi:hypothetical protein [Acetobacter orleanensis]|uniref:Uncharacterized protein n=1 Tax=Acetobacter orleanensis TaxID=104099 RepID=A0A4Y3TKU9_9PROT|nr:hypothetical protein [Acetobacter orleanensis]KXV62895.1 hypothetical protein AD949_09110 [Acetobacter orleanensis]PCD80673.1 hypothetical protein CO710_02845 [Acetobacter orleanensis]GAN67979.1 hypothetical protein Abol_014_030 [Acetobacter orleanensis JCM 7639]GBR27452.1 hypothetical protein AA0473_1442 [Acetobacter orleanensis NRIC 0473]GEB82099.1 hypothetical protein AOR01nite_05760 [Acetobacter orleanensis]